MKHRAFGVCLGLKPIAVTISHAHLYAGQEPFPRRRAGLLGEFQDAERLEVSRAIFLCQDRGVDVVNTAAASVMGVAIMVVVWTRAATAVTGRSSDCYWHFETGIC